MILQKDVYIKKNVKQNEFILARLIGNSSVINTPTIIDYDEKSNIMKMQKLKDCISLADFYGEQDEDTPNNIYDDIRKIIKKLINIGIDYVDITGYNFMINPFTMKLYIIDFEHAYVRNPSHKIHPFITTFLNGYNGWNPQFK
jgi:tRNA A-37 threonylcarbamoyl transferase component Bud32